MMKSFKSQIFLRKYFWIDFIGKDLFLNNETKLLISNIANNVVSPIVAFQVSNSIMTIVDRESDKKFEIGLDNLANV